MVESVCAGAGVHGHLVEQVEALRRWRGPVLRAEDDAVHQMRVATRRLRSFLSTYGHLYAQVPVSRGRLRWLAGVLGEARDLEVLRMRFAKALGQERPEWFDDLCREEHLAYGRLAEAFGRKRFEKLLDACGEMAERPHFALAALGPAEAVLLPDIEAARVDLADALAAVEGAEDPDAARHNARKAAKRCRYTAEAAAAALGEDAEVVGSEAKRLQTVCGKYQDDLVALAYLVAHAPGEERLLEAERDKREKHLAAVDLAASRMAE